MRLAAALLAATIVCGCSSGAADHTAPAPTEGDPTSPDSSAPTPAAPAASADAPGSGALRDATAALGLDEPLRGLRGHAVAVGDIDGDGWQDLFVGTFADRPPESYAVRGADGPTPDRLLYGGPDGFTLDEGFPGRLGRSAGAHFADLDGDGDLDLIVSRNVRAGERASAPSEIYRNDAGRLRTAITLDDRRGGRAVGTVDHDGDGRLDIVLVEDRWSGGSTAVFHNDGDLRFSDATEAAGLPGDVWGLGLGIGDLDGDGSDDLVIGGSNRVFLHDGDRFVEATTDDLRPELHGDEDDPAHVALADLDGDGRLDVLVGQHFNSTLDGGPPQPVRLYRNRGTDGDGTVRFDDVTAAAGLVPLATKAPRVLVADLDGNGSLDVITTASTTDGTPLVFHHDGIQGGTPRFDPSGSVTGPHYWSDAVTFDADGDSRLDVFVIEWEPTAGSKLFVNQPQP